jgi:hypothetical protein
MCNIADINEKENVFVREPATDAKNPQLQINLKTSRAVPEEYFSVMASEVLEKLSP